MTEDEKKKRQEFNRQLFVLQTHFLELQELFSKIGKSICDLWLLNDDILEERDKNGLDKSKHC